MKNPFFALAIFGGLSFSTVAHAEFLPVCDRTPAVKQHLVGLTGRACDKIVEEDLLKITRVAVGGQGISEFKPGDFTGLRNLQILNIRSNSFVTLPPGLMADLTSLQTLVIIGAFNFRVVPEDFLEGLTELQKIHVFRNPFTEVPEAVVERLIGLKKLQVLDFNGRLSSETQKRIRDGLNGTGARVNFL